MEEILMKTDKHTKMFTFDGLTIQAKVVDVHDGDTIRVTFIPYSGSEPKQFHIRLFGIDCCEITSKDPIEKKYAIKARDYLRNLILNQMITLQCMNYDKYGRILGNILYNGENVNKLMLKTEKTTEYFGKTKVKFEERH